MSLPSLSRNEQVRLTGFDNEPLARLAEQRLFQAGIPCFIRSLRGGPGLWESPYNLPHDLYVYESDETLARELLELTSERLAKEETFIEPPSFKSSSWAITAGIMLAMVFLVTTIYMFANPA